MRQAAIEALDLPQEQQDAFAVGLAEIPAGHGMRALWLAQIRTLLSQRSAALLAEYDRFATSFALRDFGYAPVRDILLCFAKGSRLCYPELPVEAACNRTVQDGVEVLASQTILQALISACDNNLEQLIQMAVSSQSMFYNFGDLSLGRSASGSLILTYEGHSTFFTRHYAVGYHLGLIELFGLQGSVRFDAIDTLECSVHIDLVAATPE